MTALFEWQREAPRAWQDTLAGLFPQGENVTSYRIVWEPGEPESITGTPATEIQRWMIWQFRPVEWTRKQVLKAMHDDPTADPRVQGLIEEHPRRGAFYDKKMGGYRKAGGKLANTDRLTYELYQQTGMLGTRWWVIQGDVGGHRYALTSVEKKLLAARSKGRVKDVPYAGDLPYAPFDRRVIKHLLSINKAQMWHKVYQYAQAYQHRLDQEERDEAMAAESALFDWLSGQFAETFDEYKGVYKDVLRNTARPVGVSAPEADVDALKESMLVNAAAEHSSAA